MAILLADVLTASDMRMRENYVTKGILGERGGSVVECRTPEREVRG